MSISNEDSAVMFECHRYWLVYFLSFVDYYGVPNGNSQSLIDSTTEMGAALLSPFSSTLPNVGSLLFPLEVNYLIYTLHSLLFVPWFSQRCWSRAVTFTFALPVGALPILYAVFNMQVEEETAACEVDGAGVQSRPALLQENLQFLLRPQSTFQSKARLMAHAT